MKKRLFLFGTALTAVFTLASCTENSPTSIDASTNTVTATTAIDTTTTETIENEKVDYNAPVAQVIQEPVFQAFSIPEDMNKLSTSITISMEDLTPVIENCTAKNSGSEYKSYKESGEGNQETTYYDEAGRSILYLKNDLYIVAIFYGENNSKLEREFQYINAAWVLRYTREEYMDSKGIMIRKVDTEYQVNRNSVKTVSESVTTFSFNKNGDPVERKNVTQIGEEATTMVYEAWTYNCAGKPLTHKLNENTLFYSGELNTYDENGVLIEKDTITTKSLSQIHLIYSYDSQGNITKEKRVEYRISLNGEEISLGQPVTYELENKYTEATALLHELFSVSCRSLSSVSLYRCFTISFGNDTYASIVAPVRDGDVAISYEYNSNNQIASFSFEGDTYQFTYTEGGYVEAVSIVNSQTEKTLSVFSFTYDSLGRITEKKAKSFLYSEEGEPSTDTAISYTEDGAIILQKEYVYQMEHSAPYAYSLAGYEYSGYSLDKKNQILCTVQASQLVDSDEIQRISYQNESMDSPCICMDKVTLDTLFATPDMKEALDSQKNYEETREMDGEHLVSLTRVYKDSSGNITQKEVHYFR